MADFTAEECEWFNELRQDAQGIFTDATLLLLLRTRMASHKESRPAIQTLRAHVLYGILKAQDPYKAQYIKATFLRKEGCNFEAREFNTCDFTYQQCLKMVFGNTAPASQAKPPQANRAATILPPGAITPQSFVEERSASETVSVTTSIILSFEAADASGATGSTRKVPPNRAVSTPSGGNDAIPGASRLTV